MTTIRNLYIWTVLATAACATLDVPGGPVQTVNVSVGDVTDNRSTGAFGSECKLELKFTGDAASDAAAIRQVRLKKAIDDLGRDLSRIDDNRESFHSFNSGQRNGVLKTEVRLRNPSRNANTIKVLDGEVELFSPTLANGGVLIIKDILKHPAEPVQNEALKKYGVEVVYLTKESYEAKKKQFQEQQTSGADAKPGEVFGDMFKGMLGAMTPDSKNSVKLYVKDPEKRVIDVEFQDAGGNALKTGNRWSIGDLRHIEFKSAPPPDTQLLIHLATPEALRAFPFKLDNVPLP